MRPARSSSIALISCRQTCRPSSSCSSGKWGRRRKLGVGSQCFGQPDRRQSAAEKTCGTPSYWNNSHNQSLPTSPTVRGWSISTATKYHFASEIGRSQPVGGIVSTSEGRQSKRPQIATRASAEQPTPIHFHIGAETKILDSTCSILHELLGSTPLYRPAAPSARGATRF